MRFSHTHLTALVAASILSADVQAAPTKGAHGAHSYKHGSGGGGSSYRIHQIHNPSFTGARKSGAAAMARVLNKYNVQLSPDLQSTINTIFGESGAEDDSNSTTTDTVIANPQPFDREYLSPVQIGYPPQTLNLDFDTGSADLWVFSTLTPATQEKGQIEYNPLNSTTSQLIDGASWSISYGDGSGSSGTVYTDQVSIGPVTVFNQAVESASRVSSSFTSNAASSGLLGLGFSTLNTVKPTPQKTFFENAMASLALPLFTANLKKAVAGNYNFGFIDQTEYTGDITYTPVDSSAGFWGFSTSGFQIGDQSFNSTSWKAIADTGTSLMLLPNAITDAYWAQVSGAVFDSSQAGYVYPCSVELPDFTFGVDGHRGVVPGSFLNYAPISSTQCFGGIQSDSMIGYSIFGDIALKAQLVVFDGGNKRLGWANKPL